MALVRWKLVLAPLVVLGCTSPPAGGEALGLAVASSRGSGAVVASLAHRPTPTGGRAVVEVKMVPAATGYQVQATTASVHRWVPGDILRYRVVLAEGSDQGAFDVANGVEVMLPVKGPEPGSAAVFSAVPHGKAYRAFVTAEGNVHGVVVTPFEGSVFLPLNAVPGTADFDFTAPNDVPASVSTTVQVVLDEVPFSGTAGLSFDTRDGSFTNPSLPISASPR